MKKLLLLAMLALPLVNFAQTVNYHRKDERHFYTAADSRVINRFPDSVRIELPDQNILIVLEAKNFNEAIEVLGTLPATAKRLAEAIEKAHTQEPDCKAHVVRQFSDLNDLVNIEITENQNPTTKVISSKDQLIEILPAGWEIYLEESRHKIFIYTDQPAQLNNISASDLSLVAEKLKASRNSSGGRKSLKSRFIVKGGALAHNDVRYYQPLDMLSLSLSASAGVVRNTIFPEINGNVGIYIADRFNKQSHRVELSYNSMYFARQNPEGGYDVNYSPFVGLSYSKNVGKKDTHWYGIGAAWLLKQGGDYDFFKGNTMKVFFITTVTGGLSFVPEFYLTNDLSKMEFGMKMQYRF
jgi:hypothetical protein